jgi:site-specific recombinase XerD
LLGAGIDVKTVADLLGHSKPSTTLDTYAASIPSLSERATATMGRLLSSSVG